MAKLAQQRLGIGIGVVLGVVVTLAASAIARGGGDSSNGKRARPASTTPHLYTLHWGDVIHDPRTATRCEATAEGGIPRLFCTRTSRGRYQVEFWSDSVSIYDLLDPKGEPMMPTFTYKWEREAASKPAK